MIIRKTFILAIIGAVLVSCSSDNDETGPRLSNFSLSYPANDESNIIPGIQLQWEPSENASSYELQVSDNAQVNMVFSDITNTFKTVDGLLYGKTYFWKVTAKDESGNTLSSSTHKFHTQKNYSVLNPDFSIPQLDRTRKVSIYLPPGYNNESVHYPVLYMHDGQAIFDTEDYPYEEWEVDETLDRLYQETGFSLIVVGIDYNATDNMRLTEYSPWVNTGQIQEWAQWSTGLGGEGDEYMEFIVETLKPYIDTNFRTLAGKENTGILGSSMGGLISCYAGLYYPDVFGKIGVYSPSLWFSEGGIYELATTNASLLGSSKFYFLAGDSETSIIDLSQDIQDVMDIFTQNGVEESNLAKDIVPNGTHEEYLWREGFEETIRWLFIE